VAPRLRETGLGRDRQSGGIGGRGAGERAGELDRRKVRDRIAELRSELAAIEREAGTRRSRRSEQPTVALVGYTNAGKSSWMRALTGSGVLVEDKLFATLDTTVRALRPETVPRILVSDTVGFIKKLPHDLVASFRSTLEEARDCDLLVHVVDASDPSFPANGVTLACWPDQRRGRAVLLSKADRLPAKSKPRARVAGPRLDGAHHGVPRCAGDQAADATAWARLFVPWARRSGRRGPPPVACSPTSARPAHICAYARGRV
jgi:GTP-binding protein HflX